MRLPGISGRREKRKDFCMKKFCIKNFALIMMAGATLAVMGCASEPQSTTTTTTTEESSSVQPVSTTQTTVEQH